MSLVSCKKEPSVSPTVTHQTTSGIEFAQGFDLIEYPQYTLLRVTAPWPDAKETFTYVLAKEASHVPDSLSKVPFIKIPVQKIVVTSTTHIPSLVHLKATEQLIGFPGLDYISSPVVRKRIAAHQIIELQANNQLNVEKTIDAQPDLVVGHGMDANNPAYTTLEQAGIATVFNGDWVENTPLGKAEWIKFFGALLDKKQEANTFFTQIVTQYKAAQELVAHVTSKPTVISGSMYQDVWYAPQAQSWMAQFIEDAKGNYLWSTYQGVGSVSLSFETALQEGQEATYWIGPGQFTHYAELEKANRHYTQFKAFKSKKIYTYSAKKGATGGLLFYEEAPNRPDLVLKDLIFVLHPEVLPAYQPAFIEPLH